jgi:hypothetical protein
MGWGTAALVAATILSGCAALRSFTALSQVGFALDGASGVRLAGVELDRVRSFDDLSFMDVARIGSALTGGQLPLEATIHVAASNPGDNPQARLTGLEWTLHLRDRETVSGGLDAPITLPSGETTDLPVQVRLDLLEFFDTGMRDLVELGLSLAGMEREPVDLRLELVPTVQTSIGPIRYPRPVVLGGRAGGGAP